LDDVRGLSGQNGTLTVTALKLRVEAEFLGRNVEVKHDILRIVPGEPGLPQKRGSSRKMV
jgi:hypothetical protein